MKMTFRWYGPKDAVTPEMIAQIPGMTGVVSAVYDVAPGEVWPEESIAAVKNAAAAEGLAFEVVESVPVPEDIKLGNEKAPRMIENYCETVRRLGRAGVKCVCYNFMPVFDWLRSDLYKPQPHGAHALAYDEAAVLKMDPQKGDLNLPGWDASYTKEELGALLDAYKEIDEERLWENLGVFLKKVIPAAAEAGVDLAIHPDDPPWGMFGLPRIITGEKSIERLFSIVDVKNNGLTLCTGSLGANPENDLVDIASSFADRIHFLHLRNIKRTGVRQFEEVGHPTACGSVDVYGIAKALVDKGWDGYCRPDHGRMIWGESGKGGYGLYDRALGSTYLTGLFEALEKGKEK